MAHDTAYDRNLAHEAINRERGWAADDHQYEAWQGGGQFRACPRRAAFTCSKSPPENCTDGSLIIDAEGQISKATAEQQQIALSARASRAKERVLPSFRNQHAPPREKFMPAVLIQQIEADIAEIERLMTELRLKIAVGQSAGEDMTESERRVQEMVKGWMLLQDQRQKAAEADLTNKLPASVDLPKHAIDLS
jgi:hypothetical protein